MSVFGTIAGGAVQAGLGAINNVWAQKQQGEARRQNYLYGEMAAENADARTRALYNDFYSPQALMRQYREAGLSPSMMFGGTPGQGGTSGAQGSGAAGLGTPYMPMSMIEGAQIANIAAQTEKTKEETATINETRQGTVENLWADLNKKFAETNNYEAQTTLTKLQSGYQAIANEYAKPNFEVNLKVANAQCEVLANQSTLLLWQGLHEMTESQIAELTKAARVENAQLQNQNIVTDILSKNTSIKFTENQIEILTRDIENKSMLAHAEYIEHMAGAAAKYSEAEFKDRANKFFDDQIDMWMSDFKKDFYKFGEQMGLEKDKLDLQYKQLEETIRHNKQMECNMAIMALNPFGKIGL